MPEHEMPSESNPDLNWAEIIRQTSERFGRLSDNVIDNLRELLVAGRRFVNCAESALLLPTADGSELKFLASVNSKPGVAEIVTQMSVPCEGSLVGVVYNTGQPMAIADPDEFYTGVSEKTGLSMNVYLVTPVVSGEEIIGVVTFLNRPDDQPQEPFDAGEIESAMKLTDLAAASLKYYRRLQLQYRLFQRELAEVAERLEADGHAVETGLVEARDELDQQALMQQSPLAQIMLRLEGLSRREQDLAAELVGVVSAYIHEDEMMF